MAISDQQIITGLAILGAAINSLSKRTITVYHFNMVTDMGWVSSNIHLMSLCVMRHILETRPGDYISQSKAISLVPRTVRIVAMMAHAVVLLYCAKVSGYELWNEKLNCPALCVAGGKRAGTPWKQMIVTYVFVIQSYTFQIVRVIPTMTNFWATRGQVWLEKKDMKMAQQVYGRKIATWAYSIAREIVVVAWYLFTSDVEFVLEMMAWYGLGLYWTFTDRDDGHKHMDEGEIMIENRVGFGQLVPMLLLLLALLGCVEAYMCKCLGRVRWSRRCTYLL